MNETNKESLRARLVELDAKATPGPWITQEEDVDGREKSLMGPFTKGMKGFDQLTLNYTMSGDNAELLCFLRNSVPDILEAFSQLDASQARVKELESQFAAKMEINKPHRAALTGASPLPSPQPSVKREPSPDWVIQVDAVNGPCFVNECLEGDPGRTCDLAKAERYATENEASENMHAISRKYPNRKYSIHKLPLPSPNEVE